jgi:hypothetical protein
MHKLPNRFQTMGYPKNNTTSRNNNLEITECEAWHFLSPLLLADGICEQPEEKLVQGWDWEEVMDGSPIHWLGVARDNLNKWQLLLCL